MPHGTILLPLHLSTRITVRDQNIHKILYCTMKSFISAYVVLAGTWFMCVRHMAPITSDWPKIDSSVLHDRKLYLPVSPIQNRSSTSVRWAVRVNWKNVVAGLMTVLYPLNAKAGACFDTALSRRSCVSGFTSRQNSRGVGIFLCQQPVQIRAKQCFDNECEIHQLFMFITEGISLNTTSFYYNPLLTVPIGEMCNLKESLKTNEWFVMFPSLVSTYISRNASFQEVHVSFAFASPTVPTVQSIGERRAHSCCSLQLLRTRILLS